MQKEDLIAIARLLVAYSIMSVTGTIALVVHITSFGVLANVVRAYVGASSRMILALIGVRLVLPQRSQLQHEHVMYTFNHNSFLDVLIVTALALPNTRPFLSERTLKFVPVTISAIAIGTWYIPTFKHATRRAAFFERVTSRLRTERTSVIVSSEGVHEFVHGIAPFNDGVYRIAIEAGMPIVPLYFHIPRNVNSLEGYRYESGSVRVEVLPEIDTRSWRIQSLDEHVASTRAIFVRRFNEAHETVPQEQAREVVTA